MDAEQRKELIDVLNRNLTGIRFDELFDKLRLFRNKLDLGAALTLLKSEAKVVQLGNHFMLAVDCGSVKQDPKKVERFQRTEPKPQPRAEPVVVAKTETKPESVVVKNDSAPKSKIDFTVATSEPAPKKYGRLQVLSESGKIAITLFAFRGIALRYSKLESCLPDGVRREVLSQRMGQLIRQGFVLRLGFNSMASFKWANPELFPFPRRFDPVNYYAEVYRLEPTLDNERRKDRKLFLDSPNYAHLVEEYAANTSEPVDNVEAETPPIDEGVSPAEKVEMAKTIPSMLIVSRTALDSVLDTVNASIAHHERTRIANDHKTKDFGPNKLIRGSDGRV